MLRFIKTILLAATFLAPASAIAKPVTMQCLVKGNASKGWIQEQIFFEFDEEKGSARVVDGIILHYEKKAKAAKLSEMTNKKVVISWDVKARAGSQTTKMNYRLAFFRENGKALVKAHPHGFIDNLTARGSCRETKQAFPTG